MNLKEKLTTQANTIRDEQRLGANTALRVGEMFLAIIDALKSNEELDREFLSKSKDDQTKFVIDFLKGLKIGDKAHIDEGGNAQFNSLSVFELIINRLTAVSSDYVFSDSATIESVEETEYGYTITFHKDFENQLIGFQNGDVLRGIVTSLENGVNYTSWLRINAISGNVASVTLYPDSETPAKMNYPPTELMVLSHWGNAINKKRQSSWYLSSQEGRIVFLDGVTKPILEDRNYASFWGKPVMLKAFEGKPINPDQPYAYMRGLIVENLIRLDYNGVPQIEVKDYGLWVEGFQGTSGQNEPYIQSDVWHNGIKWRCVKDTTAEPAVSNTDWVVLTGDTMLSMELISERNFAYIDGDVNDLVKSVIRLGQMDVTSKILPSDWSWTRDTGNPDRDTIWNEQHKGLTNKLELSQADIQDADGVISFTCTAYYRENSQKYKIENSIDL